MYYFCVLTFLLFKYRTLTQDVCSANFRTIINKLTISSVNIFLSSRFAWFYSVHYMTVSHVTRSVLEEKCHVLK